ncbi:MAG: hypothetical protein ACK501_20620 [Planctomycetota bacterium]
MTMISPGTESRVALLSSIACLALVAWLVIRSEASTSEPPLPLRSEGSRESQLEVRIGELASRIASIRDAFLQQPASRIAAPAAVSPGAAAGEAALAALQLEVQSLRLALQDWSEAQPGTVAGMVSHSLSEIRREFPTTNWVACEAMLQRALAEPGAADLGHLDSDNSKVLGELMMLRPRDVLLRLGSPSRTGFDNGRFRWTYESPKVDSEGQPEQHIWVTFEKGYVWDVNTDVSGV